MDIDLVIIGHLVKEKIIFSDGKEMGPVLGSPVAYASVAAARIGLKVGIVTRIGEDLPIEFLNVFKEVGVDTEGIRIGENTTTNLLIYEKYGKKRLEFLKKANDILFEDIPGEYLNAPFFLIAPVDYEVPENTIKFLHEKGRRLSMELGGFGGASSAKDSRIPQEEKIDFLKKITQYFDIVKGGEEDCVCLFGDVDVQKIAKQFIEWGAKISIITLGEKGALVMSEEELFQVPSFHTKVVDCTGAGDVWHAGFLAEYISENKNAKLKMQNSEEVIKKSAIFASSLSSILIKKSGGVKRGRFPTYREVIELIRSTRSHAPLVEMEGA
jgi:sugar/nucleoside kinase (ribokinase family)